MFSIHALHLIESLTKLYALGGELISITFILASLNFMAGLVQKTYQLGQIIGKFYFAYLHELVIKFIAFYILGCVLTFKGLSWIYANRAELMAKADTMRNQVGALFIYTSPVTVY